MNTQNLLDQYFETAFSAPDGIKRLRELILTLAMQGKLVPQDPNDQPARELLKEIEVEKQALIKAGKIKKQKPLPEITPEEIPYELPDSWEWTRLEEICSYIQRGKSPKYVEKSDFPVIAQKCIQWNGLEFYKAKFICPESVKNYTEERFLRAGDLLWNSTGLGTLGRIIVYNNIQVKYEKIVADSHVTVIRPLFVESYFIYSWLASHFVQSQIESKSSGSTKQIELATSTIKNHLIPLPPLAEQKRIVEKCDRLMAQCDQLEQLQKEKEHKRILIHTAAREKLLKASDQETFGQAWDFIKENFGELYAVKENVTSLRQAILQLAVMGKLVPQDPNDPPASELLKEIEAEKQQLIKEGKIKKQKPLPEITADEIPYDLPDCWEWVRLIEITSILGDGIHGTPQYDDFGDYSFINGNNLINGSIQIKENTKKVNCQEYLKYQKPLNKNTVFVSINGTIGNVAFYNFERIILGKSACYFNLLSGIEKEYIKKIIESQYFLQYAFKSATGTTIKNVSLKTMRSFVIPLPPLPEQHRIVAKVDALMALCDRLENQIDQQTTKQTQLLESVMAGI